MILYFSGTGNSQFVALEMASVLNDEVTSINGYLKKGQKAVIHSERPLIWVTPTYSWRIPRVVEQWIMATDFIGSQDAYFVPTCSGSCGNAAVYAQQLCDKKGLRFCGLAPVLMPENYLALFTTPSASECQAIIAKAKPQAAALAAQIAAGQHFPQTAVSWKGKLASGPINPLFYALFVHDRGFAVSSRCVSCGKCAQRCPLNNITLDAGKPVWQGHCTHCMACIGGCPVQAITYREKTKERHHHYMMNDDLCWTKGGQEQ